MASQVIKANQLIDFALVPHRDQRLLASQVIKALNLLRILDGTLVINAYWHHRLLKISFQKSNPLELFSDQRLLASQVIKEIPREVLTLVFVSDQRLLASQVIKGTPSKSKSTKSGGDQRLLASQVIKGEELLHLNGIAKVINAYWHHRLLKSGYVKT